MSLTTALLSQLQREKERSSGITPYSGVPISRQLLNQSKTYNTGFSQADGHVVDGVYYDPQDSFTSSSNNQNNQGGSGGSGGGSNNGDQINNLADQAQSNLSRISDSELNAIYNPQFNAINEQRNLLTDERTRQESLLTDDQKLAQERLTAQALSQRRNIGEEETEVRKDYNSALRDAVRGYNSLKQQGNARFGAVSSAGGAVSEIMGQEFLRQSGDLQEVQTENLGKLGRLRIELDEWENTKKLEVDQEFRKLFANLRAQFNQQFAQLNTSEGRLRSDREARRLEIRQDYQNQINQIAQWRMEQLGKLEMFRTNAREQIDSDIKSILGTANQTFDSIVDAEYVPDEQLALGNRQSIVAPQQIRGNTLYETDEDEFDSLTQPQFIA